jgi:preprotein translocase subunit SecE
MMLDNVKDAPTRARDQVVGWWDRSRTFLTQVRNEVERVTWPSRKEVYATTVVVILTSVIFGVYLWGIDLVLDRAARLLFTAFGAS